MDATTIAVDLAKDVFEVACATSGGRIPELRRLNRQQFQRFLSGLPAGVEIVMEACGTAHYWGRHCQSLGLVPVLLPTQYVRPYVRRNKTDRSDAEALVEARRCAGILPVPVVGFDELRQPRAVDLRHTFEIEQKLAMAFVEEVPHGHSEHPICAPAHHPGLRPHRPADFCPLVEWNAVTFNHLQRSYAVLILRRKVCRGNSG